MAEESMLDIVKRAVGYLSLHGHEAEAKALASDARAFLAAGASEGQAEPIGYAKQSQLDGMSERRSALVYATACSEEGWNVPVYTHPSAEIAALRERIAGMEKDAERYRKVRAMRSGDMLKLAVIFLPEDFDEFVDAVTAEEKKG